MMKTSTRKFNSFFKTGVIAKTLSLLVIAVILLPASCKKDKKTTPEVYVMVSTFAGTGVQGADFKDGEMATFNEPNGVAVDKDGNVYVADKKNHRIRKITKDGVVSTLAGTGDPDFLDGKGTDAEFNNPTGVAVDKNYNVYVADYGNHRIRKITQPASGEVMVSTLAGTGIADFNDGTGTTAEFHYPYGVAVAQDGIVYVSDQSNHRIRKITQSIQFGIPTIVSTLAGTGDASFADTPEGGGVAKFHFPAGIAVDAQGIIYIGDSYNHRIRKITKSGVVSTFAGGYKDPNTGDGGFANGAKADAKFNYPNGVAVDAQGNVYIGDKGNNRVRKITPAGDVSTMAGTGGEDFANGKATAAKFNDLSGVAIDAQGRVYVADTGNSRIRKIE